MASYAETLARMMRQYPTLFPTEAHALHHLFLVNGNGYDWIEGQLVDPFARPDEEVHAEQHRCEERLLHGVSEDLRTQIKAEWAKPAAPIIQLSALCKYAALCTLPDDIRPDWLAAAKHALAWAWTRERTGSDTHWLLKARARIEALEQRKTP